MAPTVQCAPHRISIEALTKDAFAPFGTVICSDLPPLTAQQSTLPSLPPNAVYANQMTAVKHLTVTQMDNLYDISRSQAEVRPLMTMFSCAPRPLRRQGSSQPIPIAICAQDVIERKAAPRTGMEELVFDVRILERHPFTYQTFIPMALDASDPTTCYLVIVAPTATQAAPREQWPWQGRPAGLKGSGPPQLSGLRAFLAKGDQAVTYAPGTWHAPMVVLGLKGVHFVVSQFANGVAEDDCQEVNIQSHEGPNAFPVVVIDVPKDTKVSSTALSESQKL